MTAGSRNWLKPILDFLFPPRCAGCKRRDVWLCDDCISRFTRVEPPICQLCGHPTAGALLCPYCYKTPPRIDSIRAPHYFEGVLRETIHRFKYKRATDLAQPLAGIIAKHLEVHPMDFSVIVPVPLHARRARERGYNQSELLAHELGNALGVPVVSALVRVRDTKSQMNLSANERKANVRGAFACQDRSVSGEKVLLVDDVCTTGATLEACSVALKQSGTAAVRGICVARAKLAQRSYDVHYHHIADSLTP